MRKILKLSSVLLVFAMLFSVLSAGFTVGAASASDFTFEEPNIISAELSKGPELAIHVSSSDDGVNAAGGNDSSGTGGGWNPGGGGWNPGGSTTGGNGSLDSDGTMTITGGIVLALTKNGMMECPTSNYITASNAGVSANELITVVYNNEVVTAFKTPKQVSEIIYSNSNVATLSNCTIYRGGTYSGALNADGYGTGGTITGGTQITLGSGTGGRF